MDAVFGGGAQLQSKCAMRLFERCCTGKLESKENRCCKTIQVAQLMLSLILGGSINSNYRPDI